MSKTKEAESFLRSNPKCASAPQLYSKVDDADKKYNKVDLLLKLSEEKYGPLTWEILKIKYVNINIQYT